MDEVDQKQQQEINDLQKKDIAHDNAIQWMERGVKIGLYAFIMYIIASGALIFMLIEKLDKCLK